MKRVVSLFLLVIIASCQKKESVGSSRMNDYAFKSPDSLLIKESDSTEDPDENSDMGTFYVVEVAEGNDFAELDQIAQGAASLLGSKTDMMNRIYRKDKGIIVPEDSDDDIYSGEYYPRRPFYDQNFVSIEMAYAYKRNEKDTLKMTVLANIFENKAQSDSVVKLLLPSFKGAKTLKTELFLGCMH